MIRKKVESNLNPNPWVKEQLMNWNFVVEYSDVNNRQTYVTDPTEFYRFVEYAQSSFTPIVGTLQQTERCNRHFYFPWTWIHDLDDLEFWGDKLLHVCVVTQLLWATTDCRHRLRELCWCEFISTLFNIIFLGTDLYVLSYQNLITFLLVLYVSQWCVMLHIESPTLFNR